MKLSEHKKIHFAGIGGISMSGLAEILLNKGYKITGSDSRESETTERLNNSGITIYIGHSAENISEDTDLLVYTAALSEDNEEIQEARRRGIKVIDRAELLGLMMKSYTYPISIAGTHGKTTTSSMLTEVLLDAQKDPTVTIGGILNSINGNFRIGSKEYFVAESCEYCDSFLKFNPFSGIILNIERDHTDYFKTMEQMYNSFNSFAKIIPDNGFIVINSEIPEIEKVIKDVKCKIITFGNRADSIWQPDNIVFDSTGCASYNVLYRNTFIGKVTLSVPGMHNVLNSLSVFALSYEHGISTENIINGLANFKGTHRRFEYKGSFNEVKIIDDYAHHPTEIKSTLQAAKSNDINSLWCVFQPHTYSRTKSLLNEFSEAFDYADNIIILDIYAAREKDNGEIHSKDLVEKLIKRGRNAQYINSFDNAVKYLSTACKPNDMLITMGAGDVYLVGEALLSTLSTELPTT